MPTKGITTGADLYEEVKKVLQKFGCPSTEISWEEWIIEYGQEEQRRIFAHQLLREECNESLLHYIPLFNTP
jgi:hypothetical protein